MSGQITKIHRSPSNRSRFGMIYEIERVWMEYEISNLNKYVLV